MPRTLDFPPPNGIITFPTSACQSFNTLIPTVQIRQAFSLGAFTTNYKGNKHWIFSRFFRPREVAPFIYDKVRQEAAFTQILNNIIRDQVKYQSGIWNLLECDICWKMLPLYWQALCWTQLLSMHENTFRLLQKITPCEIKWWGAQWRNANHLVFSGTNRTGWKSLRTAWFDFLIIPFLLQWREMLRDCYEDRF